MNLSDFWKSLSDGAKGLFIAFFVGLIAFFFIWEFKLKYAFSKKVSKRVLARAYKVNNKILKKWIQNFGSPEAKELYAKGFAKKVKLVYFTECLGSPSSRPKHNGKPIIYKQDIWEASGKSESMVYKKIKALENPEFVIGMSVETFLAMRIFPPKQINLILEFIKTGVGEQPDFLTTFNPGKENADRNLP